MRSWCLALLLTAACSHGPRVVFVGNSFTRLAIGPDVVVDVPMLIDEMAAARGAALTPVVITKYGATLSEHAASPTLTAQLARADAVVLQDQSRRPIVAPGATTKDACGLFGRTRGRRILFETWARADAPGDFPALDAEYGGAAHSCNATLAPVGRAFELARRERPALSLYAGDGIHPNAFGAYLAACVLYVALFHQDPSAGVAHDLRAVERLLSAERFQGEKIATPLDEGTLRALAQIAVRATAN
jgi:hypothetical protein